MALTNAQYDAIMRVFNSRQQAAVRIQEQHEQEAYAKIPELKTLDEKRASLALEKARALLGTGEHADFDLAEELRRLSDRRQELLKIHGYPDQYLEPSYTCPLCRDTGYAGQEKCQCFLRLEAQLLYAQSHLENILEDADFRNFSLDYYPDEPGDSRSGRSAKEEAADALEASREFVRNFGSEAENLLFYGNVGVGKTFLSCCIAKELLSRGKSVLYMTAWDLFDTLSRYHFDNRPAMQESHDLIFDCELLIIDDLGTEMPNTFVASQLFLIVNERILNRKQTVISTNLSLPGFRDTFSDRTFSRIYGHYRLLHMSGPDIRTLK